MPAGRSRTRLLPGVPVVQRDNSTVQVGVDPDRRVLIRNAPAGTYELLCGLDGLRSLADLAQRVARRHQVSAEIWNDVLSELHAGGFLIDEPPNGIADSAGAPTKASRGDATAVVLGTGRVACSVATLLASSGVGHVSMDSQRALRASDATPAGLSPSSTAAAVAAGLAGDREASGRTGNSAHGPLTGQREVLAAMISRAAPAARTHSPSGYLAPTVAVLAPDGEPDPVLVRRLVCDGVPHLAVRSTESLGVVGPLVLPGRSSCLLCHDLVRRDDDPGWPHVVLALQQASPVPPTVLATAVASLAAQQALRFLDRGDIGAVVDGTIEVCAGDWRHRRRSWRPHPDCPCRAAVL